MIKTGMTSKEIEQLSSTDTVEWMRELAWQLAKLREENLILQSTLMNIVDKSRLRITKLEPPVTPTSETICECGAEYYQHRESGFKHVSPKLDHAFRPKHK